MNGDLTATLAKIGMVSRRQHPHLIGSIDRAVKNGELVRLFPGTYSTGRDFTRLVHSLFDWDPDAVLVAGTAAKVSWWPDVPHNTVHAVTARHPRVDVPGISVSRAAVPPELTLTRNGVRFQHPSASTIDLARRIGTTAIDEALRRRAVSIASLHWAFSLMPGRKGNTAVARYLRDSADEPWSPLEREAHRLLRSAGITGWKTNYRVLIRGKTMFLDVAFPGRKIALEFDGWQFHGDRSSFIRDRERDVALRIAGWTILRFTLETLPSLVNSVRSILDG